MQKERNRTDKWNLFNWLLFAIIEEGHNKTLYNLILIETLVRRNFLERSHSSMGIPPPLSPNKHSKSSRL